MWIMLITKLPTDPSPPRMSIFWSIPWPDDVHAKEQSSICQECGYPVWTKGKNKRRGAYCMCDEPDIVVVEDTDAPDVFDTMGFKTPNWTGARKIHYKDTDIRVFPHEFTVLKKENMKMYVFGTDGYNDASHIFVPGDVASESIQKAILEGDMKHIYDAALVDGATPAQAMAVAQEIDVTLPDPDFPPTGWYRCRPEYAMIFCEEWELKE